MQKHLYRDEMFKRILKDNNWSLLIIGYMRGPQFVVMPLKRIQEFEHTKEIDFRSIKCIEGKGYSINWNKK